jgi:uncharacterized protein (UPF0218 family)
MTSDLVEHYTTTDGHVDGEEDIAASAAVAYAGESLHSALLCINTSYHFF